MPFDFKKYDVKCAQMNPQELQKEWEHYTRLISGAATSTTVSGLALPFTAGISVIGVGMAAPAIHNARKKREIIERHLQNHNTTHNTRAKDVLGSMAFSGTLGVLTLGVGSMGADQVAQAGAEHGISAIVNNETAIKVGIHAALDGAAMAGEEAHHNHKKEKAANKMVAAAQQKIALAQAQGQQYLPVGEKPSANQPFPSEKTYGDVQIPGTYVPNQPQQVVPPPPPAQQYVQYTMPPIAETKYDAPPTPQYTPAPPAYYGPPGVDASPAQFQTPAPPYIPQTFYPPPAQTSGPMSPTPSISTISSHSSHTSRVFSPVPSVAPTPLPQYAPSNQPQPVAQHLPPFQAHVTATGVQALQPQLVWSHVHNQWISQPAAPVQVVSAPIQEAQMPVPQEGYPFPPQPTDRRASVYTSAPAQCSQAPSQLSHTPTPQQYTLQPPAKTPSPLAQHAYLPPSEHAQPHTTFAYGQPTPAQTPGVSQSFTQTTPYFPLPPGAHRAQSYSSVFSQDHSPALQYAPVSTPQPHSAPHRNSIARYTPSPEKSSPEHIRYHQPAQRHYSLPNLAPICSQERLTYAQQPSVQCSTIHEQPYEAPAAGVVMVNGGAAQHHPGMQVLCDAYGNMKV